MRSSILVNLDINKSVEGFR